MGKKKKSDKTKKDIENVEAIPDENQMPQKESLEKSVSKSMTNASKQGIEIPKSKSKLNADEKLETDSIKKESVSQLAKMTTTSKVLTISDTGGGKSVSRLEDSSSKVGFSESQGDSTIAKKKKKSKSTLNASEGNTSMADNSVLDSKVNFDEIGDDEDVIEKEPVKKKSKKKEPKQKKSKPKPPQSDSSQAVATEVAAEEGGKSKKNKKSKSKKLSSSPSTLRQKSESKPELPGQELSTRELEMSTSRSRTSRTETRSKKLATSKSEIGPSEIELSTRELEMSKSKSRTSRTKTKSKNALEVSHSTIAQSTSMSASQIGTKKGKLSKGKSTSSRVFKMKSQTSMDNDDDSYSTASSEETIQEKRGKHKKKKADKKQKETKIKKSLERTSDTETKPYALGRVSSDKKKGKKLKKTDVTYDERQAEGTEEVEEDEDAFIARIIKEKAANLAKARPVPEIPKPEEPLSTPVTKKHGKKAPKKKLSKKEKARLTAELAEKQRIEEEQEAAIRAERERIRMEQEKKAAIEKEKTETVEQRLREEQLEKSVEHIDNVVNYYRELMRNERKLAEWQLYVDCGKLPNPSHCDKMNTYLHLWEKSIDCTTIDEAAERTKDVIKLLADLEYLIENSDEEDGKTIDNWQWVRQLFRERQSENLDIATYRLLRNIETNLHRIDIPTADFNYKDDDICLSLWLRVQLPVPLPNPRRPPKARIDVSFPDVNLEMLLPITIDCENMAIRTMYLKYDHLSDLCSSFYLPQLPPHYQLGLRDMVRREWRVRLKYKYNHRDRKVKEVAQGTAEIDANVGTETPLVPVLVQEEPVDFASDEEIPVVPYKKLEPTSSEYAVAVEDRDYVKTKKALLIQTPDGVLNLRKYSILGGVYYLNAVYQPPQPQEFVTIDMTITTLYLPKKIEHVPFSVSFIPPPSTEPGVRKLPEEIEEEMKKVEEELDKLIMVTLTWPQHVIFLELPLVAQWENEEQRWSRGNVHDLKHNEEKGVLTFRTGSFGIFGLAALRYANLPYQAWEVRPEADDSVTINITATILVLEFNIKEGLICISQLQNSPNNALQDMIGHYVKFYQLKKMMKDTGIDIFPEPDAFCYIEGCCEKNWPMEKHLYYNMATLNNSFNFAWSRWNLTAGRRNIVLQMREYFPNKPKQKNLSMLMVTPLKATFIDCTEVSQIFSDENVDSSTKLSCDLYNLMKVTSGIAVRKKVQSVRKDNIFVLSELLICTRVLSFS